MWRNEDLVGVLGGASTRSSVRRCPSAPADAGAIARRVVDAGRITVHLPASPLMHGTGAFTSLQAMCARRRDRHPRVTHVRPARAVAGRRAPPGHADGDRRRRVRQADAARARRGRGRRAPLRHLVARADRVVGRDVERRGEGAARRAGQHVPARLARLERGRRHGQLDERARLGRRRRRTSRSARTPRCSPTTAARSTPGSDEVGVLAVGGYIPAGYYKDEAKSASTFRTFAGRRWSVPGDFATRRRRRHDHAARPRLGVHQLGRREGVPRGGRGSGEAPPGGRRRARGRRARRALRRSRGRGGRPATPGEDADAADIAAALDDLARYKRPRTMRVRRLGEARPERQGRLRVGQADRRERPRPTLDARTRRGTALRAGAALRIRVRGSDYFLPLPEPTLASTSRALRIR